MSIELIINKSKTIGKYKYNKDFEEFIIQEYNLGKGVYTIRKEIEKILGYTCALNTIYKILHKNNIKMRTDREQALKYTCNEGFFEKIDTEEKAYWLGFMYSDGFLQAPRKHEKAKVGITLTEDDKNHLEKFKNDINFTGSIKTYSPSESCYEGTKNYSRILISSPKMAEDLIKNGCGYKKTLSLSYPSEEVVPKNLERHFVRGLIEGNGSLIICYENNPNIRHKEFEISFTGTKSIVEGVKHFFNKDNLAIVQRFPEREKDNYSVTFGGNDQVLKIIKILYEDAKVYLDRKYEKYLKMLEYSRI